MLEADGWALSRHAATGRQHPREPGRVTVAASRGRSGARHAEQHFKQAGLKELH